jgi:protein-tyrosine phosphatase
MPNAITTFVQQVQALLRQRSTAALDPASFILALPDDWERTIPLASAPNLRDIGGYATTDGQRVRKGMVYRAGSLSGLTTADMETLSRLNLRLVCDLRSDDEVNGAPDRLPPGTRYLHVPILADDDTARRLRALLFNREQLYTILMEGYTRVIIDKNAGVIGRTLRSLSDEDALPAVIHCTAGKDRTGVAIALLLLALGVPEDTVLADYTLSNHHYHHFLSIADAAVKPLGLLGIRGADLQPLLIADAKNLRATLEYVRQQYGSVERYLRDAASVDDATLQRLRATLLE